MDKPRKPDETAPLRSGWTTGACATAATKAALTALATGEFPDPVTIVLPKGEQPAFPLCYEAFNDGGTSAGIVKDAGDDPDVTHGATIIASVRPQPAGSGVSFHAGEGVGTVTKPGLPIPPGEPAINPVPRQMMRDVVAEICAEHLLSPDIAITISVPNGEVLAQKTWNPRLGIEGGLSILGTTGIVHPFSCSAWIHSIHRGIDVARALGTLRIIAATGSTSEAAAQSLYDVPDTALIDMGDFAGGVLKYLRQHPVPNLVLAGGFAKLVKLAQGALDLHSARSQVDFNWLSQHFPQHLQPMIQSANTAAEVLAIAQRNNIPIASIVAQRGRQTALDTLRGADVSVELLVVDRQGKIVARDG